MLELLVSGFKPYKRNKIMTSIALTFQNTQFDIIDRNNQPWLRLLQIGGALGYSKPDLIGKVYQKYSDEFTENMTTFVELDTDGGKQQVRVFSLRGCHLLGMLSRTKIAKEFRKWVLDVLENKMFGNTEQLTSQYITEFEAYQFVKSVKAHCKSDRYLYSDTYSMIYEFYGITSYKKIPAGCLKEAAELVCGIRLITGNPPTPIKPRLTIEDVLDCINKNIEPITEKKMAALRAELRHEVLQKLADDWKELNLSCQFLVSVDASNITSITPV